MLVNAGVSALLERSGTLLLHKWSLFFNNLEEICVTFPAMRNVLFHNRLGKNGEIPPHKMSILPRNFRKMADVGCVIFHEFPCAPPRRYA